MKQILSVLIIALSVKTTFSQAENDVRVYIDKYKKIAVEEMIEYGIPASITLAQGIHESNAGRSKLAVNSNNHFGIKCHSDWTGKGYKHDDDAPQECFRVYENPEESYRDHSKFLKGRRWYNSLFELPCTDYVNWAHGLKKAGYATNPKYAHVLISIIDKYRLHELDKFTQSNMSSLDSLIFAQKADTIKAEDSELFTRQFHFVEQGESLYSISKKYNTTVEAIQKANKMTTYALYVGQKLIIN